MASLRNIILLGACEDKALNLTVDVPVSVGDIKERFKQRTLVDWSLFSLTRGGVILDDGDTVGECAVTVIHAHPLLKGGKGGFGSLIRAMGSQINKSTNKEACRNLGGRRVRDINAEKKLAEWAAGEPERKKKEAEEKRQRLERKRAGPRHTFDDTCYMEQIKSTEEGMDGALKQGLKASSSGSGKGKTKAVEIDRPSKRPKLWLGVDEELSDSDSEEEGEQHYASDAKCPPVEEIHSLSNNKLHEADIERSSEAQIDQNSVTVATPTCSTSSTSHNAESALHSTFSTSDNAESASHSSSPPNDDTVDVLKTSKDDGSKQHSCDSKEVERDDKPVDLSEFGSADELALVGGERLKLSLQLLGLKCGGTPRERALRLFSTKGKTIEQLDPSLFAKSKKGKLKKK